MKYIRPSFIILFALASQAGAKSESTILLRRSDEQSRSLSVWSSFLSFVSCPPGPLGKHCSSSGSSGGSSSGGSSGGSSSGGSSSGGSSSGGSSSGGSSSSGSSSSGSSSSGSSSSGSSSSGSSSSGSSSSSSSNSSNASNRSSVSSGSGGGSLWSSWFGNGSKYNDDTDDRYGDDDNITAQAVVAGGRGWQWAMVIGGIALIATGFAVVAHTTSNSGQSSILSSTGRSAHLLHGSVSKRMGAFQNVVERKLMRKNIKEVSKEPLASDTEMISGSLA